MICVLCDPDFPDNNHMHLCLTRNEKLMRVFKNIASTITLPPGWAEVEGKAVGENKNLGF